MRRAPFSPIRLIPLLAVLFLSSCFSLPKVPVIQVIDDFAEDAGTRDGGFAPGWNVFGPWTCGPHLDRGQPSEGGQNGGQDAGVIADSDGGPPVSCALALATDETDLPIPPSTATHALVASFQLTTPSSVTPSEVEVVTRTKPEAIGGSADAAPPPMTVNLTGFNQLIFNARLLSITTQLPTGTEVHVELHCSSTDEPLIDQDVSALIAGASSWKTITLPLSDFTPAAQRGACLATVESIAFIVVPGSALAGTKVTGTLQLYDIRLQ